jgi:GxxExxY protein
MPQSDEICRLAWAVWHKLGNGFTRDIYADALETELLDAGVPFRRNQSVPIYYKDILLPHSYTADFVVDDKIILRVAARKEINEDENRVILSLLNASKMNLGIHINYSDTAPQFKRVVVKTKFINSSSLQKRTSNSHSDHSSHDPSILNSMGAPRMRTQSSERGVV